MELEKCLIHALIVIYVVNGLPEYRIIDKMNCIVFLKLPVPLVGAYSCFIVCGKLG